MKINVEFEDLRETVIFAEFINGRTAPAQEPAQSAPAVQPAVPASTPPAGQAQPAAQGVGQAAPVQQPVQPAVPTPPQQVPTVAPSYTLEDLGRAGVTLMESGKKAELEALVASFGVASLQQLPEAQYGAFATALRSMGAPI